MELRSFGLRSALWWVLVALLLLNACGSPDAGGGGQTAVRLDFDVRVDDGIEAHVVVHRADGSVIAYEAVDVETRRASFTGVPQDAMVTALARSVGSSSYGTVDPELQTYFEATTYPASYVAGRSFYFGFYTDLEMTISGRCPEGADSVQLRSNYSWYTVSCFVDPDTSESAFSRTIWLDSARLMQTNGAMSFILVALEGNRDTHFALLLDVTPEDAVSGVVVAVDAWRVDFGTNRLSLSFPALSPGQSAMAWTDVVGRYRGREVRPQTIVGRGIDDDGEGTAEFEYVPFPLDQTGAWQGLRVYEYSDDGYMGAGTYAWNGSVTLPLDASLTLGSTLWPLPTDLEWTDGDAPVLSFEWSGPAPTAGYAYVASRDYGDHVERSWRWYWPGDQLTLGELAFPRLPAGLQAYVPVFDPADYAYSSLTFGDYERLDTPLPGSANQAFLNAEKTGPSPLRLGQGSGLLPSGEASDRSTIITLR